MVYIYRIESFLTPSACKLTLPLSKVTEIVNSEAAVKKREGNLTKLEGFVIEFEIEEVKGEEIGYYLKKVLRKQMRMGKHYTNLILESVNETAPVEVVVKASWHKGYPEGVSVSKRVNVTSVGSSEREKVPVMSLWGMILLVVLLCLFAASSIRKGKGMGRIM